MTLQIFHEVGCEWTDVMIRYFFVSFLLLVSPPAIYFYKNLVQK